jgi:hypothetical protein
MPDFSAVRDPYRETSLLFASVRLEIARFNRLILPVGADVSTAPISSCSIDVSGISAGFIHVGVPTTARLDRTRLLLFAAN